MGKKLYVGNLSFNTSEQGLEQLFAQCGAVESCRIMTDRDTGRSRGFAFVEFSNDEEAQAAVAKFNGVEFEGRALTVNEARPQENRGGGGFGGGRGAGGGGGGFNRDRGGRGGYGNDRQRW